MSVWEIVEGLGMGLMFAQMKYFLPTSAALHRDPQSEIGPVLLGRCPNIYTIVIPEDFFF